MLWLNIDTASAVAAVPGRVHAAGADHAGDGVHAAGGSLAGPVPGHRPLVLLVPTVRRLFSLLRPAGAQADLVCQNLQVCVSEPRHFGHRNLSNHG